MDNKKMASDMELEDVRKERVRSVVDELHKKASSVLSLVTKWKEFEDQYQSMQGSIEVRLKEALSAEELVVQRYQEIGARAEELRMREESLEVRLKEILEREEEVAKLKLSLIEQQREQIDWFRQKLKDIELERNSAEKGIEQMREIQERTDRHCKAIRKETAERDCILEEKLSELSWREHRLEQQVKKFELEKRKHYEEIEERSEVLDMKERELEERSKELERGEKVPERKRKELARKPPSIMGSSASNCDDEDYLVPRKISKGISTAELVAKQKDIHGTSKAGGETQLGSDEAQEPDTIELPNSDFTDFDKQKAVECFAADQVWAVYDSIDSMPRYYARVTKVTFSPEFKLVITWLDPNSDKEDEQIWDNAGLPVACGKFKNGRTVKTSHRFMFSHQMSSLGGVNRKSTWLIYPKKGEIWAVFKDWSMEWKAEPEKHTPPYHFDCVEVCSNFDRSTGIKVSYLSKVEGFTSIYERRPAGSNGIASFRVPEEEMYRFSHQIPSNHMTGKEAPGVPAGSFELDTAALPGSSIIPGHPNDVMYE